MVWRNEYQEVRPSWFPFLEAHFEILRNLEIKQSLLLKFSEIQLNHYFFLLNQERREIRIMESFFTMFPYIYLFLEIWKTVFRNKLSNRFSCHFALFSSKKNWKIASQSQTNTPKFVKVIIVFHVSKCWVFFPFHFTFSYSFQLYYQYKCPLHDRINAELILEGIQNMTGVVLAILWYYMVFNLGKLCLGCFPFVWNRKSIFSIILKTVGFKFLEYNVCSYIHILVICAFGQVQIQKILRL